jgi:hypothetical protein
MFCIRVFKCAVFVYFRVLYSCISVLCIRVFPCSVFVYFRVLYSCISVFSIRVFPCSVFGIWFPQRAMWPDVTNIGCRYRMIVVIYFKSEEDRKESSWILQKVNAIRSVGVTDPLSWWLQCRKSFFEFFERMERVFAFD